MNVNLRSPRRRWRKEASRGIASLHSPVLSCASLSHGQFPVSLRFIRKTASPVFILYAYVAKKESCSVFSMGCFSMGCDTSALPEKLNNRDVNPHVIGFTNTCL